MTRLTISTDSPDELRKWKKIIAENGTVTGVKGPKNGESGRLNYYIFVTEKQRKARK